jgi:hypothetical protein
LQDVQVPVFIDVVERGDLSKCVPDLPELVVPSVVRLQPTDRSALLVAEMLYFRPLGGVTRAAALPRRPVEQDRERRLLSNCFREVATEALQVEIEDEVVECAPEIEQVVARYERPVLSIEFDGIDVKAVFESAAMAFRCGPIALSPTVGTLRGDTECSAESFKMSVGPLPLCPRSGPGHGAEFAECA